VISPTARGQVAASASRLLRADVIDCPAFQIAGTHVEAQPQTDRLSWPWLWSPLSARGGDAAVDREPLCTDAILVE
jgi:hypothetical protein